MTIRFHLDEHYHSGIGLLTPARLHNGQADQIIATRHHVLCNAYEAHPERFAKGRPQAQQIPVGVWINPPPTPRAETKTGFRKLKVPQCAQRL